MTAFQELAYISKIDDSESRQAIYDRNNRREFIWGEILLECEKVIKANNVNINKLIIQSIVSEPQKRKVDNREQQIFGREYHAYENEHRENDIFVKPTQVDEQSFLDNNAITQIVTNMKEIISLLKQYYSLFITSGFGIPLRHTVRREAERLCPVPVTVGNAIIAISLIVTHAYDEDKKGTVSSTITDVLDILEKSVTACGHFIQNPPSDLVERDQDNLITMLHELSMNAFFEVTVKYNRVLKDVSLAPDVLRLVNWTLENASRDEDN
jgi:nucleoporin NDC1